MLFLINTKTLIKEFKMFFWLITFVFIITTVSVIYALGFVSGFIDYQNLYNDEARSFNIIYNKDDISEKAGELLSAGVNLKRIYMVVSNPDGFTEALFYEKSEFERKIRYGEQLKNSNEIIAPETAVIICLKIN